MPARPMAFRSSVKRSVLKVTVIVTVAAALGAMWIYVTLFTLRPPHNAKVEAETGARVLRTAASQWQAANNSTKCPALAQLTAERHLDPEQPVVDPWGTAYHMNCSEDEIVVSSAGSDQRWGTRDDIAVPRAASTDRE